MKNMRKLLAVALLLLTLGLPVYADESGQMDTPKPGSGTITQPPSSQTVVIQDVESDPAQTPSGQMDTTLIVMLDVIESILALI